MTKAVYVLALAAAFLIIPAAWAGDAGGFTPMGLKLELTSDRFASPSYQGEAALRSSSAFAGAIGLQVAPSVWVEGEAMSRRVALEGGDGFADTELALVNVSFQPELGKFTPFLTAGAGVTRHDGQKRDSAGFVSGPQSESGNGFAWQLGGGLQFHPTNDLAFAGSYRYLNAAAPGMGDSETSEYNDHEVWVRANYDLPIKRQRQPLEGSRFYNE
jgi:opacity protein-like surface antigen